jgi:hypothetical protein
MKEYACGTVRCVPRVRRKRRFEGNCRKARGSRGLLFQNSSPTPPFRSDDQSLMAERSSGTKEETRSPPGSAQACSFATALTAGLSQVNPCTWRRGDPRAPSRFYIPCPTPTAITCFCPNALDSDTPSCSSCPELSGFALPSPLWGRGAGGEGVRMTSIRIRHCNYETSYLV